MIRRHSAISRTSPIWLIWIIGLLPIVAFAQADPKKLDAYIANAREAWGVPGLSVVIVKDDQVALARGYGVRELGKPDRVDEHTLFAIASNTKAFTSAALAILVDEKKISWDDRVQKYLPWFQLYDPYVSSDLRIRDLLCHRSGLGTFSGDLIWYGTSYGREEIIRRARFLPQDFPFRSGYGYSNIMFVVAGEVVARVSGMSWDEFIRTRLLTPLGMKETVLSTKDLAKRDNVATPHGDPEGRLQTFPWYNWDNVAAAGGIISSVSDLSAWLRLQLNRGSFEGKQIFSETQARVMWTPHVSFTVSKTAEERIPQKHFNAYGLGWGVGDYRGNVLLTHGGGYDGMYSQTALVPGKKLGMVILTNSMTGISPALMYHILDAYLGGDERDWSAEDLKRSRDGKARVREARHRADAARRTDTKPSLSLDAYAGTYGGPMYGDAEVKVENGRLAVKFLPNPDLTGDLTHWQFDTFEIAWRHKFPWFSKGKVQFLLDEQGKVTEMKINVPNDDFWFYELEFKKK
jgi:CubicO group peptidase (beta-lactamase class C family)